MVNFLSESTNSKNFSNEFSSEYSIISELKRYGHSRHSIHFSESISISSESIASVGQIRTSSGSGYFL